MAKGLILFSCIFLMRVLSQAPSCMPLDESNLCGKDFAGYPISLDNITSTADFNYYMGSLSLAEAYGVFGCKPEDINQGPLDNVRYQKSFWCSYYINEAKQKGCSVNSKDPALSNLCPEECTISETSMRTLLSKCSNNTTASRLYEIFSQGCKSFAPKNGSVCNLGTDTEAKFCGWNSMELAKSGCQGEKTTCCKSYTNTNSTTTNSSNSSKKSFEVWKIGLMVGGLVLVLILAILVIIYRRRHFSKSDSNSLSQFETPSNTPESQDEKREVKEKISPLKIQQGEKHTSFFMALPNFFSRKTTRSNINSQFGNSSYDSLAPQRRRVDSRKNLNEKREVRIKDDSNQDSLGTVAKLASVKNTDSPTSKSSIGGTSSAGVKNTDSPLMKFNSPLMKSETSSIASTEIDTGSKQNQVLVVVEGYEAICDDELDLKLGDHIYCVKEFDDGWALGCNPITEKQGVFPIICTKRKKQNSYVDFLSKKAAFMEKEGNLTSSSASGTSVSSTFFSDKREITDDSDRTRVDSTFFDTGKSINPFKAKELQSP
jgi:hypothetical protein